MFDGVGDSFSFVPDSLKDGPLGNLKNLRTIYRYSVVYNFFIFV